MHICFNARFLLLVSLLLNGCTTHYAGETLRSGLQAARLQPHVLLERKSSWTLHQSSRALLISAADLQNRSRHRALAQIGLALESSLSKAFPGTSAQYGSKSLDQAFLDATALGSDVLIFPRLLQMDNPRNSWHELYEGKAMHPHRGLGVDWISFQVLCFDVASRSLIDITTVSARGRVLSATDHLPLDLVDDAAEHYVNVIAGNQNTSPN